MGCDYSWNRPGQDYVNIYNFIVTSDDHIIDLPENIDGLPNISGAEKEVEGTIAAAAGRPVFLPDSTSIFPASRAPSPTRFTCTSR